MKVYYKEDGIFPATYCFKDDAIPTEGDHYGTYSFKDEADGAFPSGWVDGDGADCATTVIALKDGHRKVLQFHDDGIGTRAQATINVTQGLNNEFEFFLTKSSIAADTGFYVWLYEGATRIIYLLFEADDLQYNDGAWKDVKLNFLVANTLSHFRIVLDDTANTFDCYIDGILEGADLGYENNSTSGIDSIVWRSDNTDTGYYTYMDALGVKTDPNYNVGDNINPYGKPSDITDFIDTMSHQDADTSITIVASLDGHKKLLKITDTNGAGYLSADHAIGSTKTDETIEFWWAVSSITSTDGAKFVCYEGATEICGLYINLDDLRTYNPALTAIKDNFILADTLFHVKLILDDTANTFDCYINGVNEGTFNYRNNSTTGIDAFVVGSGSDDIINIYFDAIGIKSDPYYNVGDNRYDDYHYYSRTLLTNIIQYPAIIHRNNMYCLCSVVLRDFEGALYDTWYSKDFTEFVIEDNDENKIFRGYLINKNFAYKQLELSLAGIGIKLDWIPFYKDYVLEEGKVRIVPATSILWMYDDLDDSGAYTDAGEDFNWAVDQWIFNQTVGLLLIDSTKTIDIKTWTCSAISQVNGTYVAGNLNSLDTPNDDDIYHITESKPWDAIITPVMTAAGGDEVATTKILNKIVINYSIDYKHGVPLFTEGNIYLKIRDSDNEWVTIRKKTLVGSNTNWLTLDDNFSIIRASSDLAKFLTTDNGNWDECLELKLEVAYSGGPPASVEIALDYLTVEVHYEAYAIAPIMEVITDSTASTLTCSGVAKWDETGLSVNDDFKIGQNTVQITEDIGTESGLAITVVGQALTGGGTQTLRPNGDDAVAWGHDDSGGDGSHFKDLDEVVVQPNAGDGNIIYSSTDTDVDIFDMETHVMGANEVVKKIELWTYGQLDGVLNVAEAYFHSISTEWSESRFPFTSTYGSYGWKKVTWDNLSLDQTDLDALKIKYTYTEVFAPATYARIDLFYIVITYGVYSPFTKFIARKFRGTHCIDGLEAVCELEGADWCEDYVNNRIKVVKPSVYESSGVEITDSLRKGVEFEDLCNQVRRVDVFGSVENVDFPIHEYSEDITVSGFLCKQIINERIMTSGDAKEIADAQLAILNTKRPSLKLTLIGTYPNLQMGRTVNVTLVRPTVAADDYPIRMIERRKFGKTGIQTIVYCGLGETPVDEQIGMTIRKIGFIANRAMSDRLI